MKLNEVSVERDTTRIKIDRDRTVKAASVEGYGMSVLGKPKLMIKCGNCGGEFKTRKYAPVVSLNNELAAPCPHCGYWNLLNLHWDK